MAFPVRGYPVGPARPPEGSCRGQLRLRAVHVLKLVKYVPGGGSASDYGFEQDADGYSGEGEGDGSETPDGTEAPATEGTGDGSEF